MDDNTDGEKRTDIWMQLCKFFLNFPQKKKKKPFHIVLHFH